MLCALVFALQGAGAQGEVWRSAERFADAAGTDVDVEARLRGDLAAVLVERDRAGDALEVANGIRGYRKGVVYAEIARHYFESGNAEKGNAVVEQAEGVAGHANQVFQKDAIRAAICEGLVAAGRISDAERVVESISDGAERARAEVAIEVGKVQAGASYVGVEPATQPVSKRAVRPELMLRAKGLLALADEGLGAEVNHALLEDCAILARDAQIDAFEVFLKIAGCYQAMGEPDLAEASEREALRYFYRLGPQAEWKIGHYSKLAQYRQRWGAPGDAGKLLAEAEAFASGLRRFMRPEGYAGVGDLALDLGEKEEADRLFLLAISAGAENPNPRIGAIAGALVGAVHVRHGAVPSAEVAEALQGLSEKVRGGMRAVQ